ncbi:MAG: hypothetical protein JO027_00265 [Solirubrobacterales bacterium]|nr:hypothetical protein [Solirubrobacterales bacterium]
MPANTSSCSLTQVRVIGDVTDEDGAYATLTDSQVGGNVSVGTNGAEVDFDTSANTGPLPSSPMTVHGNLTIGSIGYSVVNPGAIIEGTTYLNNAENLQITQGTVHNVLSQTAGSLTFSQGEIDGSIVANNTIEGGSFFEDVIRGNLVLNATQAGFGNWYIEGPQEIDGNVLLTNNQEPIFLLANHIKQNLACYNNTPAPTAPEANQVDGRELGQCAGLTTGSN